MLILSADTSGKHGSIALVRCDEKKLETLELVPLEGGTFSAQLVPEIAELLSRHKLSKTNIDAFAVASGPGSFTGLRVGLAAIKALAEILQKPIAAVSLLEVIAFELLSDAHTPRNDESLDHQHEREGHDLQSCRTQPDPTDGAAESRALPAIADPQDLSSALQSARDHSDTGAPIPPDLGRSGNKFLIALDAGRNEAYFGEYTSRADFPVCLSESLLSLNELAARAIELHQPIYTPDENLSNLPLAERARPKLIPVPRPNAIAIARLGHRKILAGQTVSPIDLDATYIRRADAEIKKPVRTPA